jgi:hypothetical protein
MVRGTLGLQFGSYAYDKKHNTVSFLYDPFGRRIYKSSSSGISIYTYEGGNLVEEMNASGGVVARYTQTDSIDEPVAMLRGGTTSYYEQNGLGSVTSLSNTAGAAAQTYTFDSFGNQTASSGSLTNSIRYASREFDPETNLCIASRLCSSQSRMYSHLSLTCSHTQKLLISVSSTSVNVSDPIRNNVPHPGQHLFFLKVNSHWQLGHR